MIKRVAIYFVVVLLAMLVLSRSMFMYFTPLVIVGYALAASIKPLALRLVSVAIYSSVLVALGENASFVVILSLVVLLTSVLLNSTSVQLKAVVLCSILLMVEFMLQFSGLHNVTVSTFAVRLFVGPLIALSLVNSYATS